MRDEPYNHPDVPDFDPVFEDLPGPPEEDVIEQDAERGVNEIEDWLDRKEQR